MGKANKAIEKFKKKQVEEMKSQEQIKFERKVTKQRYEVDIKCLSRERDFKTEQLKNEILETRTAIHQPNGQVIIQEGYVDNKKPKWLIENEVDIINQKLRERLDQIYNIDQLEEKDAGKTA